MTTPKAMYILAAFVPGGLPLLALWLSARFYREARTAQLSVYTVA